MECKASRQWNTNQSLYSAQLLGLGFFYFFNCSNSHRNSKKCILFKLLLYYLFIFWLLICMEKVVLNAKDKCDDDERIGNNVI